MPELWDVLDSERRPTGATMRRGAAHRPDEYHLVVHICLFNSAGQMLIQRRQLDKEGWPGMWDVSVGGSALAGENGSRAAHRELLEELGLDIDFTDLRPIMSINFDHGFDDYYALHTEVDPAQLHLQPEEVCDARWATREEVLRMQQEGTFIPYYPSLINLLFDKQTDLGALK